MNGDDRLALKLPGGNEVSVRGTLVILVIVFLAGAGGLGYLVERGFTRMIDELKTQRTLQEIEATRRIAEHLAITRGLDRTSCLLALNPADRETFRSQWRPGSFAIWCPWILEDVR